MRRGRRGWAAWAAALAILCWGGVSHERERVLHGAGAARSSNPAVAAIESVRADLTDDSDVRRYGAYANAALGRPYQGHYVRTLEEWRAAFAAGDAGDPDTAGMVVPPAPLVPNRDYLVEYPPGFFLVALPPALVARGKAAYAAVFYGLMALLLTFALALCVRLAPRAGAPAWVVGELPAHAALSVAALGVVTTHRYDAAVALLLCAVAWAAAERRPALCGVALGLAVATKLTPVLVAPLLLAWFAPDRRALLRFCSAAAVASLAIFAPTLVLARQGFVEMLRYHAQRPLQIESTPAALLGVARAFAPGLVSLESSYGSSNLAGPAVGPLSLIFGILGGLAVLAALAAGVLRILRLDREPAAGPARVSALIDGMLSVLVAFMALGKVFSPQYLVWIVPLGVLAALLRSRWHAAVLVLLLAATQVLYPFSYGALTRLDTWACAVVLARNCLLIALGVLLAVPPRTGGVSPASS